MRKTTTVLLLLVAATVQARTEPPQCVLLSEVGEKEVQNVLQVGILQSVLHDAFLQIVPSANPEPAASTADRYALARIRAIREKRHLVVWVDNPCEACAHQLPECVHLFVSGPWYGLNGPAVVVGQLRDGELWRHDFPGVTTGVAVRAVQQTVGVESQSVAACGPGGCGASSDSRWGPTWDGPRYRGNGDCASGNCNGSFGSPSFVGSSGCASGNCGTTGSTAFVGGGGFRSSNGPYRSSFISGRGSSGFRGGSGKCCGG